MGEEKLNELKQNVIKFSVTVRDMIDKSVDSLIKRNNELAEEIINVYETRVNEQEVLMDEECINFIARYQPEAKTLRTILMISRMIGDLERMGDKAVNIAESAIYLNDRPLVKPLVDIPRMRDVTLKMLDDSITSFINENTVLAYEVLKRDDIVDNLRDQIMRELITYMISDSTTIERSLYLYRVARNLEKIADVTTNLCEEVIYIKEGKNVKHNTGLTHIS